MEFHRCLGQYIQLKMSFFNFRFLIKSSLFADLPTSYWFGLGLCFFRGWPCTYFTSHCCRTDVIFTTLYSTSLALLFCAWETDDHPHARGLIVSLPPSVCSCNMKIKWADQQLEYTVSCSLFHQHPCSIRCRCNECSLKVLALSSLTLQWFSSSPHHPSASCVDIVFQVTPAIVWHDDPCQPTVQGQVRWLISHQQQQTLGFWAPTHCFLIQEFKNWYQDTGKCWMVIAPWPDVCSSKYGQQHIHD